MEWVVKINGRPYKQVTDYVIGYNQTWSPGSGRDMVGKWSGNLIGNFDSVKFSILPESKQELSRLIKDLRSAIIEVTYYDHEAMGMITKTFYRANFEVKSFYISSQEAHYDLVNISFIPEERR